MENPVTNGSYTQQDVREYAYYRKGCEIAGIEDLLKDKKVLDGDITVEEHEEYREPLAITRKTVVTIELSTGGDADGFKLTLNEYHEVVSGTYYWADWGVYEEVRLSNDELDLVDNLYYVSEWLKSC